MTIRFTRKMASTFMLLAFLCLLFSGCTREEPTITRYVTTVDGQDIVISFSSETRSEGTIASANGSYTFSYSSDGAFTILYPNGDSYSQISINGGLASSADFDYDRAIELGYIDGRSLERTIQEANRPVVNNTKAVSPILSVLIIAVSVWLTWKPKTAWWLSRGWMFKDAEPSDLALGIYRGLGILVGIIGILSFLA